MDLYFERGAKETPKGHALVYFRQKYDSETVLATYMIALPIKVDVSKYIPPMFASQMQGMASQDLSGFAFPPLPEKFESLDLHLFGSVILMHSWRGMRTKLARLSACAYFFQKPKLREDV